MPYLAKYYKDLDLGFLYKVEGTKEIPLATFYPDVNISAWRFISPPYESGKTFPQPDMKLAISDFLVHIGVDRAEHDVIVEQS